MSSATATNNPLLRRIEASAGTATAAVPMTVAGTVRKTAVPLARANSITNWPPGASAATRASTV